MNFPDLTPSDLLQQRQALEKDEWAFKNQKLWIQKREEIENAILKLKEEINKNFYQCHQTGTFDEETTLHFQHVLEEKNQQLRQLQKSQFQIDELLDQAEDITEESLYQQRFQLLHSLWQLYPEKREEQEFKWKEWNQLRILEVELLKTEKILERIVEHLSIAIRARQSIKGRGILNYIFGLSPNIVIERQLLGIHTLILNSVPLFEKSLHSYLHHQSFYTLLQDVFTLFEHLKNASNKPWSFRHLDNLFSETKPPLQHLIQRSKQQKEQTSLQIQKLNEEIQEWIQRL